MTRADRLVGLWSLDPSASAYGERPAPRRGLFRLAASGAAVATEASWLEPDGTPRKVSFDLVPDDEPRPLPDGTSLVCRWEGEALVSEVLRDGALLVRASRTAEGEGTLVVDWTFAAAPPIRAIYRRVLEDVKQVLLYRRDLNMRKGKIAAQIAHASLKVFLERDEGGWDRLSVPLDAAMASWVRARFAKVVLSVETEADLVRAHDEARARGLPTALVTDAGHTEFHGVPTRTTVAIGPARAEDIDPITGPDGLVPTKLA